MRKLVPALLGAALAVLAALPAQAGLLTSATWETEWRSIRGETQPSFSVPITASGVSTATSVSVLISVAPFTGTTGFDLSPPAVTLVTASLILGGAQSINATSGNVTAAPGITGEIVTRFPLGSQPGPLIVVPLNVGGTGSFTTTHQMIFGMIGYVTVTFYSWTVGTRTITGLETEVSGVVPLPDLVAMGSFDLTPNGGGMITLVAPTKFQTQSTLSVKKDAALTTLTLNFVPEPGSFSLLGAAAVALGVWARWRR